MKTYIVTGAGSGMGRATAVLLSQTPETRLILIGRKKESLEETRHLCNAEAHIMLQPIDIRDRAAWHQLTEKLLSVDADIRGVFANAGVGGENHYGPEDRWEEIISINLTGTYVTIMELLPFLRKNDSVYRSIVITSSCLARFGVPNYPAYCTAKTGLLGLTRSLALQFAADRILVNAICPGWVETEMAQAGIQKLADRNGQSYEKEFVQQMSYVPLNKISQPEEIARLVKFLFSEEQTSMTGQGIDINNGSFMI
jgi:NAD(P)-dependent dehydrogenase (short-subunit alcohol dehydrogenase family)